MRGQNPDGSPCNEVYFFGELRTAAALYLHSSDGPPDVALAGIIDILQIYTFRKAGESFLKSFIYDKVTISAADPHYYAKRFVDFIDRHTM